MSTNYTRAKMLTSSCFVAGHRMPMVYKVEHNVNAGWFVVENERQNPKSQVLQYPLYRFVGGTCV